MTKLIPIAAIAFVAGFAPRLQAQAVNMPINVDRLVKSVYKAEGGANTRWPYGIKSVKCSTVDEARRICRNSMVNGIKRWEAAGKPGNVISFIASRYCPPEPDRTRWINNVTKFYNEVNQ